MIYLTYAIFLICLFLVDKTYNFIQKTIFLIMFEQFVDNMEMGLDPVPRQLEHIATNRSRNHHSTHVEPYMDGMVVCDFGL